MRFLCQIHMTIESLLLRAHDSEPGAWKHALGNITPCKGSIIHNTDCQLESQRGEATSYGRARESLRRDNPFCSFLFCQLSEFPQPRSCEMYPSQLTTRQGIYKGISLSDIKAGICKPLTWSRGVLRCKHELASFLPISLFSSALSNPFPVGRMAPSTNVLTQLCNFLVTLNHWKHSVQFPDTVPWALWNADLVFRTTVFSYPAPSLLWLKSLKWGGETFPSCVALLLSSAYCFGVWDKKGDGNEELHISLSWSCGGPADCSQILFPSSIAPWAGTCRLINGDVPM